jgi:hypothetical protein
MDGLKITALDLILEGERGNNYGLRTRARSDYLIIERKAGSVNGSHYHLGQIPEKNPEVIVILSGRAQVSWRNPGEKETRSRVIERPSKIEIRPMVWHQITALTDIVFLEEGWLKKEQYEFDTRRGQEPG